MAREDTPMQTAPSKQGFSAVIRRALKKLQGEGIRGSLGIAAKNLVYHYRVWRDSGFDKSHGVRTSGYVYLEDLDIPSANKDQGVRYQPSSTMHFRAMLAHLPPNLERFTFIDFGCGRGRALLLALDYPFKAVIGVEFSPALQAEAQRNIELYQTDSRQCLRVEARLGDATSLSIPPGPLVVYFFDPFRNEVMRRVLANITDSYCKSPRKIFLLYYAPVHADMVLQTGIFHPLPTRPLPHDPALPRQYGFKMFGTRPTARDKMSQMVRS
jgi:SAM-dependent methyltransferase